MHQKRRLHSSLGSVCSVEVARMQGSTSQIARARSHTSTKICIWMTVVFTFCWLPIAIFYLLCSIEISKFPSLELSTVFISLASSNSILNPIIYFAMRQNFRDYFKRLFSERYWRDNITKACSSTAIGGLHMTSSETWSCKLWSICSKFWYGL